MKHEAGKLALVAIGAILFGMAGLLNQRKLPSVVRKSEEAKQICAFKGYYSFYASPGSYVDVICVSRDHVSGEKPAWFQEILRNVQVIDSDLGYEWTNVSFNLTRLQAIRLSQAQAHGNLRFLPRP